MRKLLIKLSQYFVKKTKKVEKDANEWRIKYWLKEYLNANKIAEGTWQLHHIDVKTKKDVIEVTLTLGKPGIFIGLRGENINHITKKLTEQVNREVVINLIEYDIWK